MGKNILVTGGAGYIGSHACKALAKAGYTPIAYDSLVCGHREAVRWGPLVEGDLADRGLLADTLARFEVAAVIHFAAFAYVGESMAKPQLYFHNNVVNTLTLLDAMLAARLRHIVFSSSCATYGTPARLPITEDTPQRPVNPYGESKLICERAIHWYGEAHGMTYAASTAPITIRPMALPCVITSTSRTSPRRISRRSTICSVVGPAWRSISAPAPGTACAK